jgi:hypothetical protein
MLPFRATSHFSCKILWWQGRLGGTAIWHSEPSAKPFDAPNQTTIERQSNWPYPAARFQNCCIDCAISPKFGNAMSRATVASKPIAQSATTTARSVFLKTATIRLQGVPSLTIFQGVSLLIIRGSSGFSRITPSRCLDIKFITASIYCHPPKRGLDAT